MFGYPFPIAGHDWSELPEMMSLLCDASKKTPKKKKKGTRRKGGKGRGADQTLNNGQKGIK